MTRARTLEELADSGACGRVGKVPFDIVLRVLADLISQQRIRVGLRVLEWRRLRIRYLLLDLLVELDLFVERRLRGGEFLGQRRDAVRPALPLRPLVVERSLVGDVFRAMP